LFKKIPHLRANVWKFYLSSFLGGWTFATGFLIFYYREIGFSYQQIFIVTIFYEGLNFLLEIPTGVLADLWSRKWTITLGYAISGTSFLIVMFKPEAYWMFLLWAILSAICSTLSSGTYTATIYDTLFAIGKKDQFTKVQGHTFAIRLLTSTVSLILGGFLSDIYGFRLVLLLSGIGGLLQALVLATIVEPPVHYNEDEASVKSKKQPWYIRSINQIVSSFSVMFKNAHVRWILAYGVLSFIMYEFFGVVSQLYLGEMGYNSRFFISLFTAGFALATAITSIIIGQIKSKCNEKFLLILISFGITLPFIVIGLNERLIGIGALFIICIAIGMAVVVLPDIINKLIPSDKRATILSAQNQLSSISYAITAIILGKLMDRLGLFTNILIVGIISTFLFTIILLSKPKNKNINYE